MTDASPPAPGSTILVTGGAGYIGSHTCKALSQSGFSPVVYDDLSNGRVEAVQSGPLVTGDVRDLERLSETMTCYGVAGVIHFAGLIGDPPVLIANPSRARSRLDWQPRFDDLQEIVDTAVAWRRARRFGEPAPLTSAA